MRTALVTLAIGSRYIDTWKHFYESRWRTYAARHAYDLIIIDTVLDPSARATARSPAWQKCLILEQRDVENYDRVVWIDSDIIINPTAPPILDGVPPDKIGATDESRFPSREITLAIGAALREGGAPEFVEHMRRSESVPLWHVDGGTPLDESLDAVVQSGVLVLTPALHRSVLRDVYDRYEDLGGAKLNYEMRPLSYEVQRRGLFHRLDDRFNAIFYKLYWQRKLENRRPLSRNEITRLMRASFEQNYFLHFAGVGNDLDGIIARLPF